MNRYELAIVINGEVSDETKGETLEKIKALIQRFDGNIEKIDDRGKRRLAYEIQKVRDGFYYFISFSTDSKTTIEIGKQIRIMETVLRFLVVKMEE